jgi:hypothetical protein
MPAKAADQFAFMVDDADPRRETGNVSRVNTMATP